MLALALPQQLEQCRLQASRPSGAAPRDDTRSVRAANHAYSQQIGLPAHHGAHDDASCSPHVACSGVR